MSVMENLRRLVSERLTAAAEEILGAVENTFMEYEREIEQQRRLLDLVWKPKVKLERIDQLPWSQKEHISSLNQGENISSLNQEEHISSLNQGEHISSLDQEENISSLDQGEHMSSLDQGEHISSLDQGEHISSLDQGEHIFSLDQVAPKLPQIAEEQEELLGTMDADYSDDYFEIDENLPPIPSPTPSEQFEGPYTCRFCRKTFSCKSALAPHFRTHTGEKPFKCRTCGKRFITKHRRDIHMGVHSKEKPYSCTLCGKKLKYKSSVTAHMRTHKDTRPYACSHCPKAFTKRAQLREHAKQHASEMNVEIPNTHLDT